MGYPRGDAVRLLILTVVDAARSAVCVGMRYSDELIDPDKGDGRTVRVIALSGKRTKNGEPHLIPLSTAARAVLDSVPNIAGGCVFTARGGKPMGDWSGPRRRWTRRSASPRWTIHDIRRTVATGMQKLGVALPVTEACLGHTAGSRGGIVKIYQKHQYLPEKVAALESWGAKVLALVEGRQGAKVVPLKRPA